MTRKEEIIILVKDILGKTKEAISCQLSSNEGAVLQAARNVVKNSKELEIYLKEL